MWVVTRTDDRDLINLDHVARVSISTGGRANVPQWLVVATMTGGDIVVARCPSEEEAVAVRNEIADRLRAGGELLDLAALEFSGPEPPAGGPQP